MDLRFSQIKREEIGVKFGCFKFDKSSGRYSVTKPMRFQQGWTQRDLVGGGGGPCFKNFSVQRAQQFAA